MSQTLDCEFVWKHFTTLCLHRAVGDPTSRYSALWFPEQIWEEDGGRRKEKLNSFYEADTDNNAEQCFGIPKPGHQFYFFSHLPQEWERHTVSGGERKLMVPRHGDAQRVKWLRASMLILTSVNDIPVSQSTAPLVCLPLASEFSVAVQAIFASQQWEWPAGSCTLFDQWFCISGEVEAEGNQRGVPCSWILKNRLKKTKTVLQDLMGLEKREGGRHQQP